MESLASVASVVVTKLKDIQRNLNYTIYIVCIVVIYSVYVLAFFGIYNAHPQFVAYVRMFMHTFICLFLIANFNPFVEYKMKPYDSSIIFGSALILFTNVLYMDIHNVLAKYI